jgi:hypothetical protein
MNGQSAVDKRSLVAIVLFSIRSIPCLMHGHEQETDIVSFFGATGFTGAPEC